MRNNSRKIPTEALWRIKGLVALATNCIREERKALAERAKANSSDKLSEWYHHHCSYSMAHVSKQAYLTGAKYIAELYK